MPIQWVCAHIQATRTCTYSVYLHATRTSRTLHRNVLRTALSAWTLCACSPDAAQFCWAHGNNTIWNNDTLSHSGALLCTFDVVLQSRGKRKRRWMPNSSSSPAAGQSGGCSFLWVTISLCSTAPKRVLIGAWSWPLQHALSNTSLVVFDWTGFRSGLLLCIRQFALSRPSVANTHAWSSNHSTYCYI